MIDINECDNGEDNCSPEATCTNTRGSFDCTCIKGYSGNGVTCAGKFIMVPLFLTMSLQL